jgi:hypothetical protein
LVFRRLEGVCVNIYIVKTFFNCHTKVIRVCTCILCAENNLSTKCLAIKESFIKYPFCWCCISK